MKTAVKMIVGIILLTLMGCATSPQRLGITQAKWQSLTPAQRHRMVIAYRELQLATFGGKFAQDRQDEHSHDRVNVRMEGGKVLMPPTFKPYAYQPLDFVLRAGRCQTWPVNAKDGTHKTVLRACYGKRVLYLDPSHYEMSKGQGSARFYFTPLWRRGQRYPHINTSGYARFSGANLQIRSLPQ